MAYGDPEQELFFPGSVPAYDPSADPLYQGLAPAPDMSPVRDPARKPARGHAPAADAAGQFGVAGGGLLPVFTEQDIADAQEAEARLADGETMPVMGDASTLPDVSRAMTRLEEMAARNAAEQQGLTDLLSTPMQRVAHENPIYPIEAQRATAFLGDPRQLPDYDQGAAIEQFKPPERMENETDEEYNDRVRYALADHKLMVAGRSQQYNDARRLRMEDPEVEDLGTPGAPGLLEGQYIAAKKAGETDIEGAEKVLAKEETILDKRRKLIAEANKRDQRNQAKAQAALDATSRMQGLEKEIRDKIAAAPPLTGGVQEHFKNLSGFQKFAAVLGTLAGGWIGSDQIPQMLMKQAQENLEIKKANYQRMQDNLGSAERAVDESMDVYATIANNVGDKRVADLTFLSMALEADAKEVENELANATIESERAKLRQVLTGLRADLVDLQAERQTRIAMTPEHIFTTYDPVGGARRADAKKRLGKLEEEESKIGFTGVDLADKEGARFDANEIKRMEDEGKAARGEGGYQAEARWFAKEAAPLIAANASLTSILDEYQGKDAPGRGFSAYFWSEKGRALREEIKETIRRQLRMETGAVIGDDELEDRFDSIYSGLGDDELMGNVDRLAKFNARAIQSIKAGISDQAVQFYDTNLLRRGGLGSKVQAIPGFDAEADAAALGGTLVR